MIGKISIGEYLDGIVLEERLKISQKAVQEHLEDWRLSIHDYLSDNIETYRNDKDVQLMLNRYKEVTETQYLIEGMDTVEFANYNVDTDSTIGKVLLKLIEDLWRVE